MQVFSSALTFVLNLVSTLTLSSVTGDTDLSVVGLIDPHQAKKDILALKRGEKIPGASMSLKPVAPVQNQPQPGLFGLGGRYRLDADLININFVPTLYCFHTFFLY